jgi:hypothetical protein
MKYGAFAYFYVLCLPWRVESKPTLINRVVFPVITYLLKLVHILEIRTNMLSLLHVPEAFQQSGFQPYFVNVLIIFFVIS